MRLLDRVIDELEHLQPSPTPNHISQVIRRMSEQVSIPNEDLVEYLSEKNLPPG